MADTLETAYWLSDIAVVVLAASMLGVALPIGSDMLQLTAIVGLLAGGYSLAEKIGVLDDDGGGV